MKTGWIKRRLRDATTKIGSGATPLGGETAYKSEGISLIRSLNVHDWGFRTKDLAFIDARQAKQLDNVVVEAGDVLLNITGASVARCCVVPEEMLPARVNQHVSILRPVKSQLLPTLLHYMLISKDYKDRLLNAGEGGGSTRQALTKSQLQEVLIEYPESLSEQRRIVGVLDEAFAGIAIAKTNAEKNLQNARALIETHLQAVFTQSGRGSVEYTLGAVCEFIGGSQPPKSVFSKVKRDDNVRLIQIRDYKSDKHLVYIPRSQARRFCKEDDVMIGRYGPPLFQILRGLQGAYNVALMKAVPDEQKLTHDYLFYFLKHSSVQAYVIFHSERAAGQSGLNKATLEPYPIVLPPLTKQTAVVQTIVELEYAVQRLESLYNRKLSALDNLKKSLLHQAFNGQL